MKKSIAIVSIVIALVIGLAGGYFWGGAAVTASYAPKIAAVNALFPIPQNLTSLTGQVEGISGNTLTLKTASLSANPFVGNIPTVREVTVTDATAIAQLAPKDQATFQKETQDFQQQIKNATSALAGAAAPSPFASTTISLSDIKVGDAVVVTAGENILNAASFSAVSIDVQPTATAIGPLPPPATRSAGTYPTVPPTTPAAK